MCSTIADFPHLSHSNWRNLDPIFEIATNRWEITGLLYRRSAWSVSFSFVAQRHHFFKTGRGWLFFIYSIALCSENLVKLSEMDCPVTTDKHQKSEELYFLSLRDFSQGAKLKVSPIFNKIKGFPVQWLHFHWLIRETAATQYWN